MKVENESGLSVSCRCGRSSFSAHGRPILTVMCYCDSCQQASDQLVSRGGEAITEADGGTWFVLYRKDRVDLSRVGDQLVEHRLTPESSTRRVISACCHSPLFLEFRGGHWISIYARRLPAAQRPPATIRTMTRYAAAGVTFTDGVPSPSTHTVGFMVRLLWAWIQMGFRNPTLPIGSDR